MTREVDRLSADLPVTDAMHILKRGLHRIYPIVDPQGRPVGMVSRADAPARQGEDLPTGETVGGRASDGSMPVFHLGDVLSRAVDLMLATDQGRIVVTAPVSGDLVGLLKRKDLLRVRAATAGEDERHAFFDRPRRSARHRRHDGHGDEGRHAVQVAPAGSGGYGRKEEPTYADIDACRADLPALRTRNEPHVEPSD